MMDIVPDAATIVALVEAIKKTVKFLQDLKNAKDDRAKIVRELQGCASMLEMIGAILQRDGQRLPNLALLMFSNELLD